MTAKRRFTPLLVAAFAAAMGPAACEPDRAPEGLRLTPPGPGPRVVWDPTRRPLPEIPQPNDVATFPDPTSRTGRRINVSQVAPSRLERVAREGFASMEGWGTFAPVTVAFERTEGADARQPAIDLQTLRARMRDDGHDFRDDPVYLVHLATGIPVPLDLGTGAFPVTAVDPELYWANDSKSRETTILFETAEEGRGLGPGDYRPELDLDFDGVLDHPNTLTGDPASKNPSTGPEPLLTWYERESDTLILRPLVPLAEKSEYAVVLTDRLRATSGEPVRSPYPYIHHPEQRAAVARLAEVFGRPELGRYYGDIAGSGLERVSFAWTFTTQPTVEDLELLRNGLYGRGPFAHLSQTFPPTARAFEAAGLTREGQEPIAQWREDPRCVGAAKTPFLIRSEDLRATLHELLQRVLGLAPGQAEALEENIVRYVSHFVIGEFDSPYFMGDPEHEDPDGRFRLNYVTGEGPVSRDRVQFWIAVPRTRAGFKQPFPTTMWAHGTTLYAPELVARAGHLAREGIATFGINMPGHGLVLTEGQKVLTEGLLAASCHVPWVDAIVRGRARDLDSDEVADSGGLLWTAHIFHSRDNVRQSVVDLMQAVRVLRTFDGKTLGTGDTNGDGSVDLAGDFDGDGVPDLGGPETVVTTAGNSYGGVVAQIHGAIDPFVIAAAPISGGGGLVDVASRSSLVVDSVMEQAMSPLVVAVPAADRPAVDGFPQTRCTPEERSLRFVVNDLLTSRELEIACLRPDELDAGMTVVVANVRSKERRCATTTENGRFRIAIAADVGDRIDVQVVTGPHRVTTYATCELLPESELGRRIERWEQSEIATAVGPGPGCEAPDGCQRFRTQLYPVGSPLVAPQEGIAYRRQSPELRRLMTLTQAALDPGDPVNFAPLYALRPGKGLDGEPREPRAVLHGITVGDPFVPVGAGFAFSRAAGLLPFLPPSAVVTMPELAEYATPDELFTAWGGTADALAARSGAIESLPRLGSSRGGPACRANLQDAPTCSTTSTEDVGCGTALFDIDYHSEGTNLYDAEHPSVPLRAARTVESIDGTRRLADVWAPRIRGRPKAPDSEGWRGDVPLLAQVVAYLKPSGQHVWTFGDACKAFDDATYYNRTLARFLATRGREVPFLTYPTGHLCLADPSCELR